MPSAVKRDPAKWKSVVASVKAGNKAGKQYVPQPKAVAQKAARHR